MRSLLAFFLGAFTIAACGSMTRSGLVHEYIIDVDSQTLKGARAEDDKPLSYCKAVFCYAYEDSDIRKIKKYIVDLEEQLKACQKKQ